MLKVKHLSFAYDQEHVLEDLSFEVAQGEYLAVMGESGCGKSTLLKLLYGELPFEKGSIRWKNKAIKGPAYQLVAGGPFVKYLAQDFDLMPFTTVAENISKFLSPAEPEDMASRTDELMETMELTEYRDKKVKFLSGGQQQRVALARVLIAEPRIVLLDEPFSGLDPVNVRLVQDLIQERRQRGWTTVLSTHQMNQVEALCDRVALINRECAIGLIDDFGGLTPKPKVVGQVVAVFVLLKAGIMIEVAFIPLWVRIAITILWLVGMSNAFNLSDIMDGLASGLALTLFGLGLSALIGEAFVGTPGLDIPPIHIQCHQ